MTNNQIIAEYLGWKLVDINLRLIDKYDINPEFQYLLNEPTFVFRNKNVEDDDFNFSLNQYSGLNEENLTEISEIPFDKDWNWFMSCMDKINKDFYNFEENYTHKLWESYDSLRKYVANVDLERAIKYSVSFINELNKNK